MDDEIKEIVWNEVWFGINPKEEIISIVFDNFLDDEAPDEFELEKEIDRVFGLKSKNEKSWKPREERDFYRLSCAFNNLHLDGIIAIHNAGYTQSDCFGSVEKVMKQVDESKIKGYCFYSEQDIEGLIPKYSCTEINQTKEKLLIGFGTFEKSNSLKKEIANAIVAKLNQYGFNVIWNGDVNEKIEVNDFLWQKELDNNDWTEYRSVYLLNEHIPKMNNPNLNQSNKKSNRKGWGFWKK